MGTQGRDKRLAKPAALSVYDKYLHAIDDCASAGARQLHQGNGIEINLKIDGGNLIENQSMYTFVNVTTDRTLHVIFEEKAHSVTIKIANECRGQGTVMYRAEFAVFGDEYTINDVMPDDSITFSVQADEGYSVDKVVSDQRGELLSTSSGPTDPKYTLTDVTKNETVTVYFKAAK